MVASTVRGVPALKARLFTPGAVRACVVQVRFGHVVNVRYAPPAAQDSPSAHPDLHVMKARHVVSLSVRFVQLWKLQPNSATGSGSPDAFSCGTKCASVIAENVD